MKRINYIVLSLLILFVSCTRIVVLELDPVPPRLVLNASVTSDADVSAFLSKSWFLLDSVPEGDVSGGAIKVYVNEVLKGAMRSSDDPADSVSLRGQFTLPDCRVQPGDVLRLEADAPGFDPVAAETLIPGKVGILSVDSTRFLAGGNLKMRFATHFNDHPAERNYYRLIVEKVTEYWKGDSVRTTSTFAYPWNDNSYLYGYGYGHWQDDFGLDYEDPAFQPSGGGPALNLLEGIYCRGVFPDDIFNGREYAVKAVVSNLRDSYKGDSITTIVHYDIHLMSVSLPYYNYMKIIRGISLSLGNAYLDGMVEPTKTFTNVVNGFGVVAGYQISKIRVTMPYGDTPPLWDAWTGYGYGGYD